MDATVRKLVREALGAGFQGGEERLHSRNIAQSLRDFEQWSFRRALNPADPTQCYYELVRFLAVRMQECLNRLDRLRLLHSEFAYSYSQAVTETQRARSILDLAADLGASGRELRRDKRALQRWFDAEAVTERCHTQMGETERDVCFYLGRTACIAGKLLEPEMPNVERSDIWRFLEVESLIYPWLRYTGDSRVRRAAMQSLGIASSALAGELRENILQPHVLRSVYRFALDRAGDVWLQVEALRFLSRAAVKSFSQIAAQRLRKPSSGDDFFVRHGVVLLIGEIIKIQPGLASLVPTIAEDPSPFVRQALAQVIFTTPVSITLEWLPKLALDDPTPEVRAAALNEMLTHIDDVEVFNVLLSTMQISLGQESIPSNQRMAFETMGHGYCALRRSGRDEAAELWRQKLVPELARLQTSAATLATRRWAAMALERVWCTATPAAASLYQSLSAAVAAIRPGRSKTLPGTNGTLDDFVLGRVLSVLAQQDFGLGAQRSRRSIKLMRGDRLRFQSWRLWHELSHSSTDKRQGFRHTTGRAFRGSLRAPSAILSELAQTKVPGEPVQIASEAGWRPYLPLLDDFSHSMRCREPLRIFTSQGVTTISRPVSLLKRLQAGLQLLRGFPELAALRNWNEQTGICANAYVQRLRQLGFTVEFESYERGSGNDDSVERFFAPGIAGFPFFLPHAVNRVIEYFYSVYQNSLPELALFTFVAAVLFFVRHWHINRLQSQARAQIPVVIGGWGTRGKSGTERLKAALFNSLGYRTVAKTTGCEAMFLVGQPFGKLREMFLYRPWGKATIWEQNRVLQVSASLNTEVFLWECMALTPPYVRVLQRQWMQDDISTITNTFPDHEDLQGPAGINIPEVMTEFIPHRATLLTTEHQMTPILRVAAEHQRTKLLEVGWQNSSMIAPDILARFPYAEHPDNIALVCALGEQFGIPQPFALKEMADRVVPDLGVLRTSAPAQIRNRTLEFTNGMSANEPFGSLGNWVRAGFDRQDLQTEPDVWITTLVNNRSDRVPRSQVFATMLAADISADRHYLIGSNLRGLQGYIRKAWAEHASRLSISIGAGRTQDSGDDSLVSLANRLRMPWNETIVRAKLRAMLAPFCPIYQLESLDEVWDTPQLLRQQLVNMIPADAETLFQHHERNLAALKEVETMRARVRAAGPADHDQLDSDVRGMLTRWVYQKVVVVNNYHASGNEIIDLICSTTPPGFRNRIMGMQNIKGTGLDFVYTWQAWDACAKACADLLSTDEVVWHRGLTTLDKFNDYNLLCEERVHQAINIKQDMVEDHELRARLAIIEGRMHDSLTRIKTNLLTTHKTPFLQTIVAWIEAVLDTGDAIRRRKKADRIFRDLTSQRISHDCAAAELQRLMKRQEGNWLYPAVQHHWAKLTKSGFYKTGQLFALSRSG